ncbi:hypothetical protein C5689_06195 [Methylosinus sporium]|uniref:Phage tail protein n=2 Tax=Methylosinus sporium TaxID=428 RepID=A0A2U1SSR2_METSR|nr:host specificity factor TipJ family phage tail protein [Methylosinus sporium]PWB94650.1 hypothetical protein C5689_06195 [Methylosinus sporium]
MPWIDYERREERVYAPGVTVAEIVADMVPVELLIAERVAVRVVVGGRLILQAEWETFRPEPGAVVIRVIPGNSGLLRSVLLLSATIAATALGQWYLTPALATAGISGLAANAIVAGATFAAMTGASFLVNALVPVRPSQKSSGAANSPTYAISGWSNPVSPNGAVPMILGRMRVSPPHGALPYRKVVNGENHGVSRYVIAYGPAPLEGPRIGSTPIDKYKEITLELREGYSSDAPITIYPTQVIEENVSVELTSGHAGQFGPDSRYSAAAASKIQVDHTFPGGLIAYSEQQSGESTVNSQGAWSIEFAVEARLETSDTWTTVGPWTIAGMQQRTLTATFEWTPPTRGRYEFRDARISTDWDRIDQSPYTWKIISVSNWTAIRTFRPEVPINFPYPLAQAALDIRATEQLNGQVDEFNVVVKSICPDWDSETQTWITRETRNPASLFRYVLQHPAFVRRVPDSKIDLERLQYWHERCAALGLTYDRYHDFVSSLTEILADIAAAGRAKPIRRAGKFSVAIDEPGKPVVAWIGPRNSSGFEQKQVFVKPPDAFRISFKDQTNNHEDAERMVPRPGLVCEPEEIEELSLPGVTNPEIVYREGLRRHYEIQYRRFEYSVTQSYEVLTAERLDRVQLSHDVLNAVQRQARVLTVDEEAGIVIIDETVTMEAAGSYVVIFRVTPDDESAPDDGLQRTVVTVAGETNALILEGDGALPEAGDLASFGPADEVVIDAVVKEIENGDGLQRHLTLVDYAPQIFELANSAVVPDWNGAVGDDIETAPDDDVAPTAPTIASVWSTAIAPQSGSSMLYVQLAYGAGGGTVDHFELDHRLQGAGSWTTETLGAGASAAVISTYASGDIVELRARAIGTGGTSAYSATTTHTVAATDPVPMHVTAFAVAQISATTWEYTFSLDAQPVGTGVRIKYRLGHYTTWAELTSSFGGVVTVSPYDSSTPTIVDGTEYSFGARAINSAGQESGDPIVIQVVVSAGGAPSLDFSDPANSQNQFLGW